VKAMGLLALAGLGCVASCSSAPVPCSSPALRAPGVTVDMYGWHHNHPGATEGTLCALGRCTHFVLGPSDAGGYLAWPATQQRAVTVTLTIEDPQGHAVLTTTTTATPDYTPAISDTGACGSTSANSTMSLQLDLKGQLQKIA
jgi:hypothetical protein